MAKRGRFLTAYLILLLIGNLITCVFYYTTKVALKETFPNLTDTTILVLEILGFLSIVFTLGVWNLKKWGAYGFVAATLVNAVILALIGFPMTRMLTGCFSAVILVVLIIPLWSRLD